MAIEMRPFTHKGEEFVLVKTTGTRMCDDIKRICSTTPGFGHKAKCDVDVLELKKVNKDGTLETVQKKLVEKPTSETLKELQGQSNHVEKRITKENLKTGEKSVVENVRTCGLYTDDVQNVKVEIPEKVNMVYSKGGTRYKGFNSFEKIEKMFIDLSEKAKPGEYHETMEFLSNTAKRLLRRGLR